MLSVKHIEIGGREVVIQAIETSFDEGVFTAHGVPGKESDVHYSDGHVYVMGDSGKTVAAYTLSVKTQQQQKELV